MTKTEFKCLASIQEAAFDYLADIPISEDEGWLICATIDYLEDVLNANWERGYWTL